MNALRTRYFRLQIRVLIYVVVIAVLFAVRGPLRRHVDLPDLPWGAPPDTAFVLAGSDLAPRLASTLVAEFRRDYPEVRIDVRGGGTNAALEDLLNRRADFALMIRPPSAEEESLCVAIFGDSLLVFPVALGAVAVLLGHDAPHDSLTLGELGAIVPRERDGWPAIRFAADPNSGLLGVFCAGLGPGVAGCDDAWTFLPTDRDVAESVAASPRALGVVSSLAVALERPEGFRVARVAADPAGPARAPDHESVGTGAYPLHHYLYAACLPDGNLQAGKFLTHLTSDRGQRQIERAGYLPARQVLRGVVLTRHPVGRPQ